MIGTAALAPKALGGVVDPKLKVYGTTNVRVVSIIRIQPENLTDLSSKVDASVVPLHLGTHLARTIYGIAEKAAAMIKSG